MEKKLTLTNETSEIAKLAVFVEDLSEELNLPKDLVFNLNLVLEEAVSNVIFYAYPDKRGQEILLTASMVDNALCFELKDYGLEFDPTKVPQADITLSAEEREIGGLGVFLVHQIMDTVEYRRIDGANILTMKKHIRNY